MNFSFFIFEPIFHFWFFIFEALHFSFLKGCYLNINIKGAFFKNEKIKSSKNQSLTPSKINLWSFQKSIIEGVNRSNIEFCTSIIDFWIDSKIDFLIFWIFHFWKNPRGIISFFIFHFWKWGIPFFIFHFWNILMREKITKYLFFPLKPKRITKLFCFLFVAAAIWCNQSRRPAAGRPAVVYEYIRWQLLQIKAIKLGDSLWIQWEI